jgi:hypothetical protein
MPAGNNLNLIKTMNKILKFLSLLSIVAILFSSCSPEEYDLSEKSVKSEDLVEGIAFKIEHDASNPNIVYLKSLMGGQYTPLWNHPQGRSQEQTVTLKIPFAGTYKVQFGVETRGGAVWGDTVTFTVDNMYAEFVSDPMWTLVSGGSGKEKTWYLDLDAEGTSRYFKGPIYFFTNTYTWDNLHYSTGESYIDGDFNEDFTWDAQKAITPNLTDGAATWYWTADFAGNGWITTKADFGTMTFNLKGGANITVDQEAYGLSKGTGNYMLDTEKHTIKFSGVNPVHDSGRDADIKTATEFRIIYLTEDAMQILVVPADPKASAVVYNYISKDYKDNWTPGEVKEPEPTLPDNWKTDISQTVSRSVKWVLSPSTPFNWANLDGSLMNAGWTAPEKYDSWTGFTAADAANYANFSLTLNSDDNTATYVAPDGTTTKGGFTLDEKGVYTFVDVKPEFVICGGWVTLTTTDANQWRITKIEKDASGNVTGMWVGKRDAVKPEYMVYHLIPQLATATVDPLAAWKKALVGKTFKPDINWFIDWINFDQSGGWTSATTFGTDFTSNGWVWTEATSNIAKSASIKFETSGSDIKATLTQDLNDGNGNITTGYSVSGKVVINPDVPSIKFEFPLVDYTGSPGNWLNKTNPKGTHWTQALTEKEWIFVSHGGSSLSNIDTNGFWLGCVSNATAAGDSKDELLVFHYVLAQ